jgi:hypothetical protein
MGEKGKYRINKIRNTRYEIRGAELYEVPSTKYKVGILDCTKYQVRSRDTKYEVRNTDYKLR